MGEAGGGVFRMPDGDLLEILDAPEVAVLADRAQVEAGDAERFGPNLRIPAIESPEIEVRPAVGQQPRLDRVQILDEEQEHVAVGGVVFGTPQHLRALAIELIIQPHHSLSSISKSTMSDASIHPSSS